MSPPSSPDFRTDRGTAARSGASDLALFAATPIAFAGAPALADPRIEIHRAAATDVPSTPADHQLTDSAAPLAVSGTVAPPEASRSHDGGNAWSDRPHQNAGASAAPPDQPLHATGSHIATYVPPPSHEFVPPAPLHSGVTAAPSATDHSAAPAILPITAAAAMPAAIAQALDTIKASAASLSGAVTALNEHLLPQAGALNQTVDDTLGAAQAVVDGALDHVAALGAAIAPVVDDVGATTNALISAVEAAPDHVASLVSTVAEDAHLAAVAPAVDAVTSAAGDVLHAVGGSDPAGGITTLVGMVSAADAFNVHDDGPGALDTGLAPALGLSGAVDMLADVHPADVLLGVSDHHDDALAGVLHDDGHLLGL